MRHFDQTPARDVAGLAFGVARAPLFAALVLGPGDALLFTA